MKKIIAVYENGKRETLSKKAFNDLLQFYGKLLQGLKELAPNALQSATDSKQRDYIKRITEQL